MNKVFKLVWSKTKHCYVVASELAKNRTKAPKSGIISRSLVAGVLACVVSCRAVMPVEAATQVGSLPDGIQIGIHLNQRPGGIPMNSGSYSASMNFDSLTFSSIGSIRAIYNPSGSLIGYYCHATLNMGQDGQDADGFYQLTEDEVKNILGTSDLSSLSNLVQGGSTFTAGNGITISGESISAKAGDGITVGSSGIAAKAGTNVTVNGKGISVTGNGTVASGDTGLIDGGKLYTEVRPSDNGNYVIQLELYNFISSFPLFCSFLTIP